jgi:xylulokinase
MQSAGLSHAWASGVLAGLGAPADASVDLDAAAAQAPPGADGLLFLPYLLGERSPHWNPRARGAFVGLTLGHSGVHLARAVHEGVALNLRTILGCFEDRGVRAGRIRLVGGGARSAVTAQILADVLDVETVVPDTAESGAALGAAVAGGLAVGLYGGWGVVDAWRGPERSFMPQASNRALYGRLHRLFTEAYTGLEHVVAGLGDQQSEELHETV